MPVHPAPALNWGPSGKRWLYRSSNAWLNGSLTDW